MSSLRTAKYWLLHLEKRDREPNLVRGHELPPYAIQLLGEDGGPTEDIAFVGPHDEHAVIGNEAVPRPVIAAVKRLSEGEGCYVDAVGERIEPF